MGFLSAFLEPRSRAQRVRPGGFNLLPYRQRNARLARRRCVREWLGAALAGGVAVLGLAGWQAFEGARLDARRASLAHSLAELDVPLAEHARLVRDAEERRTRSALTAAVSAPLTHLVDLLDVLGDESGGGVVVRELRHRAQETELRATAHDPGASAAWLKQLAALRDARSVEIDELHHNVASGSQRNPSSNGAAVDFAARLRWSGSPPGPQHPGLNATASPVAPHINRGDQ
ncbi:Tfp pilus assembly protein PilN [Paraburkholderia sp. GAS448]|uniref:fimbrial assembly protein n=1 Tax=Paraburkholderia sp. GAS448 TaxID=3035136 RepID=UPI003D1BA071